MNLDNFYFEPDEISTALLYIDSCIYIAEKQNLLLSHIEALELIYEHHKIKEVKEKIVLLKQKRKKLIQQNKDQRSTLTSKQETKLESGKSYVYLSIFVFLGILWWLYSKD